MPRISIIVPIYKVETYIHRCIESILAQTFTDFELILICDGSPDFCSRICDEYAKKDDRVIIIHKENGGEASARNIGLDWTFDCSNSEWIGFVDGDDWIHPCYLDKLFHAAETTYSAVSSCCYMRVQGNDENSISYSSAETSIRIIEPSAWLSKDYTELNCFLWTQLYNKSCFEGIRFPMGMVFEDIATLHRVLLPQKGVAFVDMGLYFYYQRSDSICHQEFSSHTVDWFAAMDTMLESPYVRTNKQLLKFLLSSYIFFAIDYIDNYIPEGEGVTHQEARMYRQIIRRKTQLTTFLHIFVLSFDLVLKGLTVKNIDIVHIQNRIVRTVLGNKLYQTLKNRKLKNGSE